MLSNFPFARRGSDDPRGNDVEYRHAAAHEIEPAIRLVLASSTGGPGDEHVREFVRLALQHQSDAGGAFVAISRGRILSAILSIVSPGRTMLLFVPTVLSRPAELAATRQLVEELCRRGAAAGVTLAQALLDPGDAGAVDLLGACGFSPLAELLYMQADVARPIRDPEPGGDLHWETYSARNHDAFASAILASYNQSLDCPALNGLRDIQDVIAGHRATGEFDSRFWFVLMQQNQPLAVLLLSRVAHSEVLELVYLGLSPQARGRGIGDLLMRRALASVPAARCARLSLAVDAGNLPALKLYWRHGLQGMGRKLALLRRLQMRPTLLSP